MKTAIAMHETRVGRFTAERRLDVCDGFLAHMVHRFPPGSPVQDFGEFPAQRADDWDRLLDRLARTPGALRAAASRPPDEEAAPTVGRTHEDVAWQLDHLARYEREAIRPRVETWPVDTALEFEDWEDDSEPGPSDASADLEARIEAFRTEREGTLEALRAAGPGFLDRRGRQGDEEFSACQFLRATAQHDDAHVARIGERLHRSLLEEDEE
ncbi:MAG: DinB family protein [Gemmatimonadota bacterium]